LTFAIVGYLIGFGSNLDTELGVYAAFVPQPSAMYELQPGFKYVVASGLFESQALVPNQIQTSCVVDFSDTDRVEVIHTAVGQLIVLPDEKVA